MDQAIISCLIDSGAVHTLLPRWIAELASIDCADAVTEELLGN